MSLTKDQETKLSKFMCLILRHSPGKFGIELNTNGGYCGIATLLEVINKQPQWGQVGIKEIIQVVENCDKQRFEINDGLIRARYGHSVGKIEYIESQPPETLYHGTNEKALNLILESGIRSMNRDYVHMSDTIHFATLAGQRRGELVLLKVNAKQAFHNGVKFYCAGREVWLADFIPSKYIEVEHE